MKTPTAGHNLQEMLEIYKANKDISVIFLCLPNNPLGECLDTKDVYAFLDEISPETLVVIDGAYQEYASFKDTAKKIVPSEIIAKYPNTLYSGTFSKAYGLGGMRCGYGIAQPEVIKAFDETGGQIGGGTPENFSKFIESETKKWKEVIEKGGVTVS